MEQVTSEETAVNTGSAANVSVGGGNGGGDGGENAVAVDPRIRGSFEGTGM